MTHWKYPSISLPFISYYYYYYYVFSLCISCAHSDFNFIAILIELLCWRVWHILPLHGLDSHSCSFAKYAQGNKNKKLHEKHEKNDMKIVHIRMDVWEGYRAEFMDLIIYVNFDSFFIIIFFIVATTFFLLREADSLFIKLFSLLNATTVVHLIYIAKKK